jgi:hypothetical protein
VMSNGMAITRLLLSQIGVRDPPVPNEVGGSRVAGARVRW